MTKDDDLIRRKDATQAIRDYSYSRREGADMAYVQRIRWEDIEIIEKVPAVNIARRKFVWWIKEVWDLIFPLLIVSPLFVVAWVMGYWLTELILG